MTDKLDLLRMADVKIYSGPMPIRPDEMPSGKLLAEFSGLPPKTDDKNELWEVKIFSETPDDFLYYYSCKTPAGQSVLFVSPRKLEKDEVIEIILLLAEHEIRRNMAIDRMTSPCKDTGTAPFTDPLFTFDPEKSTQPLAFTVGEEK